MDDRTVELEGDHTPMRPEFRAELRTLLLDALRGDESVVRVAPAARQPQRRRRWVAPLGGLAVAASIVCGLVLIGQPDNSDRTNKAMDPTTSLVPQSTEAVTTLPATPPARYDVDMYARPWTQLNPTVVRSLAGDEIVHAALDSEGNLVVLRATTAAAGAPTMTIEWIVNGVSQVVPVADEVHSVIEALSIAGVVAGAGRTIYLDLRTADAERSVVAIGKGPSAYDVRSELAPLDPANDSTLPLPLEPLPGGVGVGGAVALPWVVAAEQGLDPGILAGPTVALSIDGATVTVSRVDADREVTWNLGYRDMNITQLRSFPTDDGGVVVGLSTNDVPLDAIEFTILHPDGTVDRFANLNAVDAVPVGVFRSTAYYIAGSGGDRALFSAPLIPDPSINAESPTATSVVESPIVDTTPSTDTVLESGSPSLDDPLPYGRGVVVGETYAYELYVHCGVEWARIDGTWWQTAPLNDGSGNPPAGWGNPADQGMLTMLDEITAQYVSQSGVIVTLSRTPAVEPPVLCA